MNSQSSHVRPPRHISLCQVTIITIVIIIIIIFIIIIIIIVTAILPSGMAEDSSSSRQMKKTTKTYVMKTDSSGNVTTSTDVQVSGSGSSESGQQ